MSRATADDQLRFLLSCVKHSDNGKIDFVEVAGECGIVSKGAAAKRYERLMKANGIHPNSDKPNVSPRAKQRSRAAIIRAAALKRRKIEGDEYDIKEDEQDDKKSIQAKREPDEHSLVAPMIGAEQSDFKSPSMTMVSLHPYSQTVRSPFQQPAIHQSPTAALSQPQVASPRHALHRPYHPMDGRCYQGHLLQGPKDISLRGLMAGQSSVLQPPLSSDSYLEPIQDFGHDAMCSEEVHQNTYDGSIMQVAQPDSMLSSTPPLLSSVERHRRSDPTLPPYPQEVVPQDPHVAVTRTLEQPLEATGRNLWDSILIAD